MNRLIPGIAIISLAPMISACDLDQATLDNIRARTLLVCGFVTTAVQIAELIPQAQIYAQSADVIAGLICNAVLAQKSSIRKRATLGAPTTVVVRLPSGGTATVSGYFQR